MEELKIPRRLKINLNNFIQNLRDIYKEGLISVILYGSAASGEFVDKHSNLNLLVVLKNTAPENLKKASRSVNKFHMFNPLFFSESYIASSTDIFPIEFLDMKENYLVLYGSDILKDIVIDMRNLRFQCEQELKLLLLNLKQLYLRRSGDTSALRNFLFKSFTSALHISRNVMRLEGKEVPYPKQEILKELAARFQIDIELWQKILAAKFRQIRPGAKDIEELFLKFAKELEKIVDIVDKSPHF